MRDLGLLRGAAAWLAVLDLGLFRVNAGRTIGIQGYVIGTDAGEHVLVDTGFAAEYARDPVGAGRRDGMEPFGTLIEGGEGRQVQAQLALLGLTPADIDVLVMSHTHIDHAGHIGGFPDAPIVIGAAERANPAPIYWAGRSPIGWPDRRYVTVTDDARLGRGVTLLATPGHTLGHLSLRVDLPGGPVLLTCDALSRPDEVGGAFADAEDPDVARASGDRLMALAEATGARVIFGHDPAQWPTLAKAPAKMT